MGCQGLPDYAFIDFDDRRDGQDANREIDADISLDYHNKEEIGIRCRWSHGDSLSMRRMQPCYVATVLWLQDGRILNSPSLGSETSSISPLAAAHPPHSLKL